ncbi:hypothetical protein AQI88_39415 [Streptomyces cellostaticus]|uniref:Secreted protein n=1 Tax=Streptomyces cellostaticus TaxID=67285 RepID=A0A101NAT6_9ACTN|nr:hypothetical protein [Streptomyces cellostaticus]KUM89732.1 hypothetical protein AQI88_39415 [Streptomyces cellostaticus]GHI10241.1 hypothetical protein Scel_85620 [Streptomyces cellostaticus]
MKRTTHRTIARAAVALGAAAGLALTAGVGSAQALTYMGWVSNEAHGNFTFESYGEVVTVRDTASDGWGIEVQVYDGKTSKLSYCRVAGDGKSKKCDMSFPEGHRLSFDIYGYDDSGNMTDASSYEFTA